MATKDMLGVAVRKLVTLPAATLGLVCDLLEKFADPEWVEAAKRFLRKENPWEGQSATSAATSVPSILLPTILEFATITFDYGMTVEALVKACGCDYSNPYVTSANYPTTSTGKKELIPKVVYFDRYVTNEEIDSWLDENNLRDGDNHELLHFGSKNPKEQLKRPIVQRGSVSPDGLVSYLLRSDSRRSLICCPRGGEGFPSYGFLVFNK